MPFFQPYYSQGDIANAYAKKTMWNPTTGFNSPPAAASPIPQPNAVQNATVQNNVSAGPDIAHLTDLINSINQSAQKAANQSRIPDAANLEATSSRQIGAGLQGQLQPDVINQIGRAAAERGVMTGNPGGASTNADYLRSIGLTSRDQINQAQQQLTQAYARNPGAPLFDPSSQLITPYQQAQLGLSAEQLSLQKYLGELAAASRQQSYGPSGYSPRYSTPAGASSGAAAPAGNGVNWADLFGGTTPTAPSPTYGAPADAGMDYSGMPSYEFPELYDPGFDYGFGGGDTSDDWTYPELEG